MCYYHFGQIGRDSKNVQGWLGKRSESSVWGCEVTGLDWVRKEIGFTAKSVPCKGRGTIKGEAGVTATPKIFVPYVPLYNTKYDMLLIK